MGLGACIEQIHNNNLNSIGYVSGQFLNSEISYSSTT